MDGAVYWVAIVAFLVSSLLVASGIIGNSFIIATVTRKRCEFQSHGVYLTALAIADMSGSIVTLFNKRYIWCVFGLKYRAMTLPWCKVFTVAKTLTVITSAYFVVVICVERFVSVCFPHRASFLTNKRKSIAVASAILSVALVISVCSAIFSNVRSGRCIRDAVHNNIIYKITNTLNVVIRSVIPAIVLISLTSWTVAKLYRGKFKMRNLGTAREENKIDRATAIILSVCVTYIFLVVSFTSTLFICILNDKNPLISEAPWAVVLMELNSTSYHLNCALNFFIYGYFSRKFRNNFYHVLRCKCRANTVVPSSYAMSTH